MAPFKVPPPSEQQTSPYMPPAPAQPLLFEEFQGMDTNALRAGVDERQMAWCDGFMPLARQKLRTLPGIGASIWTVPSGTVAFYDFGNIGATPYCIAVTSAGGIWAINTATLSASQIFPDATIISPTRNNVGISQWGSQYILIVANQPDGYFLWDGTTAFSPGGVAPSVTVTNPGSGYVSTPSVTASGGSGSGAVFAASISNGVVTAVNVVNPGTGYKAGETISLVFTGGQSAGTSADLSAVMSNMTGSGADITATITQIGTTGLFAVTSVTIVNGGTNYTPFTTITASASPYGAPAILAPTIVGGVITGVTISNGGTYYDLPVTLTVTDTGDYYVSSVTINNGGTGYSPTATAVCSGGDTPSSQATLSLTITGGVITAVTITNGGAYGGSTPATITVTDSLVTAEASAILMPFGLKGTALETYAGRVWIVGGATLTWSAPGSFSDFSSANGGGNTDSSDSFLRVSYIQIKQTNGFLYLIGDSSVNYISGVQTGGTPIVTTFTNQNADPEVGTPWPGTVDVWSRNILFANAFGAHVSYGGAVTKISEPLDGIYNSVADFGSFLPSAAKAIVYGKKIWMLLLPIVDPISGSTVHKLFMWDGKRWWASSQDVTLQYIQHQEINSIITAYGTDGTDIYPLFSTPSSAFSKVVQSKLWANPGGYISTKSVNRFWAVSYYYSLTSPDVSVTIDSESNSSTAVTITSASLGYKILQPTAVGQYGGLVGMTLTTSAADYALVSAAMDTQIVQYRG